MSSEVEASVTSDELAELVMRWQAGWVASRGYQVSRDGDESVVVRIGLPDRDVERIALTASPSVYEALARTAAAPGAWLTAPTRDRAATESLARAAGFTVSAPEWLMATPLADHPHPAPPPGYTVVPSSRADVLVVEVMTADARTPTSLAAKGQMAVSGADAVADRIFTMPAHRRRGLGSVVMGSLVAAAAERGAGTGLLRASADGRHLYRRLGWWTVAEMVVARWPGGERDDPLE